MTNESFEKATHNRKERKDKLEQYNKVSRIHDGLSDDSLVCFYIDNATTRIYPTAKECRFLLRNIRDRLDIEISELDKEFKEL